MSLIPTDKYPVLSIADEKADLAMSTRMSRRRRTIAPNRRSAIHPKKNGGNWQSREIWDAARTRRVPFDDDGDEGGAAKKNLKRTRACECRHNSITLLWTIPFEKSWPTPCA